MVLHIIRRPNSAIILDYTFVDILQNLDLFLGYGFSI